MCGIAGMAGVRDSALLDAMLKITRHRGPDDRGTYLTNGDSPEFQAAIGSNRLKVLDLSSAGHQPMSSPGGEVWVVYNGEIFNFAALRDELRADGLSFHSQTDTEVLPLLYLKYGDRMVEHLNGIFAFAIWDSRKQRLLVARDRMGVKPLYYARAGSRLYFASEVKSLLLAPELRAELDPAALSEFLSLLYVPNPGTMFKNILKLEPGCRLTWQAGKISIDRYWDSSERIPWIPGDERELARQCRTVLKDAVRRQLVSDVPVGFFLSGGLDSSALLACAAEVHSGPLRCYTIAFQREHARMEQSGDDRSYAKLVAEKFGAECHELMVAPDVAGLLSKVIWHMDDAVADPAAIATYLICREAKSDATVLLSGQGADELFGGYRVHLISTLARRLRLLPPILRERLMPAVLQAVSGLGARMPSLNPGLLMAACRFSGKALRMSGLTPQDQYIGMRSYLDGTELSSLLNPDVLGAARPPDLMLKKHFDAAASLDFVDQMLYVDQQTFLPDLNLAYTDKQSMAASIEVRVPFLDQVVVDFMRQVPPELKLHGYTQKYILRKAMEDVLPAEVISRRKAAFGLPVRSWLQNELREMVGDLLSERRVRERGLFQPGAVARMVRENGRSRDYTLQLWSLLTLELWQQVFIDESRSVGIQDAHLD
jgi:asparagine synthase (glutamine-hydrolysing)